MARRPKRSRRLDTRWTVRASLQRAILVCVPAVAALFVAYEIVERLWLAQVDPETLHALHLLRGLSAAALTAALVLIILLRRSDPTPAKVSLPPHQHSWLRRLQHVSLRTKIVVPMVGLAVVPALGIGAFTIVHIQRSLATDAVQRIQFDTHSKARSIQELLREVRRDLLFLSHLKAVRDLGRVDTRAAAAARARAEKELLAFCQGKRAYYQVRYLDGTGREVVRLNVEQGVPSGVPAAQLQDKSDRYYVRAALALEPGEIYVSPMDLNVENGRVEVPPRRVLRYATPLPGDERERGLLVVNLFADYIVSLLGPLPAGTEAWLISPDGTYLGYAGHSPQRTQRYRLENHRRLDADYRPELVAAILDPRSKEQTLVTPEALISTAPISLTDSASGPRWTLLIAHARAAVEAPGRYLAAFLSVVAVLIAAVTATIGVLVAHYLAGPVGRLRRATREIAAGNLLEHVDIATGDEIEALAHDFNRMADRLREAQARLSGWNAELEREVARQTDHLRQLQAGLARADKIASIGQLTAGVMHEIGNPLAAIKTKIQVAQEEEALCRNCGELVSDILQEVDRLAAFLRSFSRLSRLPEPAFECLAIADVVGSAVDLLVPALRRRGLALQVDVSRDLPRVLGDANQLRQLLINLVLNAAEASPDGAVVAIRARRAGSGPETTPPGSSVALEIIDHGAGMEPEVLEKTGNPFFTTKADGTGLGLAICRRIARDHGATLEIQSQPRAGTTITIFLPSSPGDSRDLGARLESA